MVWAEAGDNFSGVDSIEMYFNTAQDGSTKGEWLYAGEVSGSEGWLEWNTNLWPDLYNGIHRIIFLVQDITGNQNDWSGPDFPVFTYNFGYHINLPAIFSSQNLTPPPSCIQDYTLVCGQTDTWNNGGTGSTDLVDLYSCTTWNESGPEYTYGFEPGVSQNITVTLSNMTGDLDVFILNEPGSGCSGQNCIANGDYSTTFSAIAGNKYYIVVDGYQGAVSNYSINVACDSGILNQSLSGERPQPWITPIGPINKQN